MGARVKERIEGQFVRYEGPETRLLKWRPSNFYLLPSAWVTWPFKLDSFVFVVCWLKWGFSIERFPVIV